MRFNEQFKMFLDQQDITCETDTFDDGRPYFRIPHKIQTGALVETLIVFLDDHVKMMVLRIACIEDDEKRGKILEVLNEANDSYKYFKFYIGKTGDIIVESDLITDLVDGEDFKPEYLLAYMAAALKAAGEIYPKIMKILWSD